MSIKLLHKDRQTYWVGRWSTNTQDKDGEYFARAATDRFIERVQKNESQLPELWVAHVPYRVGKAIWLGRVQSDIGPQSSVVAIGTFDDTRTGQVLKQRMIDWQGPPLTMSHGFFGMRVGNTYVDYDTHELSVLIKGSEANPNTEFGLLKQREVMSIDPRSKDELEQILGTEETAKVLEELQDETNKLQGTAKSAAMPPTSGTTEDGKNEDVPTDIEKEAAMAETPKPTAKTVAESGLTLEQLATALRGAINASIAPLTKSLEAQEKQIAQLTTELASVKQANAELLTANKAAEELSLMLTPRASRATESPSTQLPADHPISQQYKAAELAETKEKTLMGQVAMLGGFSAKGV